MHFVFCTHPCMRARARACARPTHTGFFKVLSVLSQHLFVQLTRAQSLQRAVQRRRHRQQQQQRLRTNRRSGKKEKKVFFLKKKGCQSSPFKVWNLLVHSLEQQNHASSSLEVPGKNASASLSLSLSLRVCVFVCACAKKAARARTRD